MDTYSFFANGYLHGNIPEVVKYDFSSFVFVDCYKNEKDVNLKPKIDITSQTYLKEIYKLIQERFVAKIFENAKLLEMSMWQGVDTPSRSWHNDYILGQTFNSNILVYLDEGTVENGNCIEVRNQEEEFKIYPKVGDFVWLNQKHIFQHRATHASGQRRVLSYELMIPEIL